MDLVAVNDKVDLVVSGMGSVGIQAAGTFVGTVTFRASIDGTNFEDLDMIAAGDRVHAAAVKTATAPGLWRTIVSGWNVVRVICTAYTSGTITISMRAEKS